MPKITQLSLAKPGFQCREPNCRALLLTTKCYQQISTFDLYTNWKACESRFLGFTSSRSRVGTLSDAAYAVRPQSDLGVAQGRTVTTGCLRPWYLDTDKKKAFAECQLPLCQVL